MPEASLYCILNSVYWLKTPPSSTYQQNRDMTSVSFLMKCSLWRPQCACRLAKVLLSYCVFLHNRDGSCCSSLRQAWMVMLSIYIPKRIFRCYEAKIEKGRQPPGIEPRTPGLCSLCATELRQLDNHQPPQFSICTAQVRLKCLSRTPGGHSVCAVRSPLGVDRKILFIRREPMLSVFLSLNAWTLASPWNKENI